MLLLRQESAASRRLHTDNTEKIAGDGRNGHARSGVVHGDGLRVSVVFGESLQGAGLVTNVLEIGVGKIHLAALSIHFAEMNELFGMGVGKRAKKNTVENAEDGRVGADAESEREDGDYGKRGIFAKGTQGEAQILRY